jgi:hypothetical protein
MTKALGAFIQSVVNGDYDQMLLDQSKHLASQCRECAGMGDDVRLMLYCVHCGKPFSCWEMDEREDADDESAS